MQKAKDRLCDADIAHFRFMYGNMVLVDVVPESAAEVLNSIEYRVPVEFQSMSELAREIQLQVPFDAYERILWPGTGARTVRKLLDMESIGESIDARRVGYKNPTFEIGEIGHMQARTLIIDDVICSGGTVLAIKEKARMQDCDIACLVMQSPRDSRLKAFGKLYTPLLIRSQEGKVPLNSLSTLLKNRTIACDYAHRFAIHPQEFLQALDLIQEEVGFYG